MKALATIILSLILSLTAFSQTWTSWDPASLPSDLPLCNEIYKLKIDPKGSVWCMTRYGASVLKDNKWNNIIVPYDDYANVNNLVFDSIGNMWFSTTGDGLWKFDGHNWSHFVDLMCDTNHLSLHYASIVVGKNGEIVVITSYQDGIYLLNDNNLTHVVSDSMQNYYINLNSNLTVNDKQGNAWIAMYNSLYKYDSKYNLSNFPIDSTILSKYSYNSLSDIDIDSKGNIYTITNNNTILKFDGAKWSIINQQAANSSYHYSYSKIAIDKRDNIWITSDSLILMYNGSSWLTMLNIARDKNGYYSYSYNELNSIQVDSKGDIWAGTWNKGVYKFDGVSWINFSNKYSGYLICEVVKIASDTKNNIWCLTGNGASKFDGSNWTNYSSNDGLISNYVFDVAIDKNDNAWFASWDGFSSYDGENWHVFDTSYGIGGGGKMLDNNGNMWCQTAHGISTLSVSKGWTRYSNDWSSNLPIYPINVDKHGNVWCERDSRILKYDGTNWQSYQIGDSSKRYYLRSVIEDSQGNIWGVCENYYYYNSNDSIAILRYDGANWTSINKEDGIISNSAKCIYQDSRGYIWVGTSEGLSKFDGNSWKSYTKADGLVNDHVLSITEDANGNMWFGTLHGLSRLSGLAPVKTPENEKTCITSPNPCSETLTLTMPKEAKGETIVVISDASGNVKMSETYNSLGWLITVRTIDLHNGLYFYKVITQDSVYSGKFMKM